MSRYIGPVCKLCRREGTKLYLKGEKCYTDKCPFERKPNPPGQRGRIVGYGKKTDYGIRLREKQKAKRFYGVLERQFKRYFELAHRMSRRTGEHMGTILLQLLERRLDNVVYRMGFAPSRRSARQLVVHRHIKVNGRTVNIPSYLVKPGDVIEVKEQDKNLQPVLEGIELLKKYRKVPEWLSVDLENRRGEVLRLPTRDEIDLEVNEQLIIEFYSR